MKLSEMTFKGFVENYWPCNDGGTRWLKEFASSFEHADISVITEKTTTN